MAHTQFTICIAQDTTDDGSPAGDHVYLTIIKPDGMTVSYSNRIPLESAGRLIDEAIHAWNESQSYKGLGSQQVFGMKR